MKTFVPFLATISFFLLLKPQGTLAQTACQSGTDCAEGSEYCSGGQCREFGSCSSLTDCLNPANIYVSPTCVGYKYCDLEEGGGGQCRTNCTGSFCPPDVDNAGCFGSQCSLSDCEEDYVSCTDYFCGICQAIYFDAAGNQVCDETAAEEGPTACATNQDCGFNEYCSSNECRAFGTCGSFVDCLNPSNIYSITDCNGYTYCDEDGGFCTKNCNGIFCPPNLEEVSCDASPCSVSVCNEMSVSCEDYLCGSCTAIFFDAAGNQVCRGEESTETPPPDANPTESTETPPPDASPTVCNSDSECGESEYCSSNECRGFGTCATRLDCLNPSNIYAVIECVGPLDCDEATGTCGRQCTGFFCPDEDDVECDVPPCSEATCDEGFVHCIDDDCGGCSAIFLDAAGNQVCQGTPVTSIPEQSVAPTCSMDDDCAELEYCSAGLCRETGSCGVLEDCFNPSNVYPDVSCVGFKYCNETTGTCGRECGASFCPPDTKELTCDVSPCNATECNEDYVSCVDYNCDNCTAIFFDSTGNQVCQDTSTPLSPEPTTDPPAPEQTTSPPTPEQTSIACSTDDDCVDSEYCSAGVCRESGTCNAVIDCQNPANEYRDIKCAGYLYCDDATGTCGRNCTGTCADGEQPVNCLVEPCSVTTCDTPFVSCVDDYCGGCNAIFFDAIGNQVCKPEVMEPEPSSTMENTTSVADETSEPSPTMENTTSVADETSGSNSYPPLMMLLLGFISAFILFFG